MLAQLQAICAGHVPAMGAAATAAAAASAAGMSSSDIAVNLDLAQDMLLAAAVQPELGLDSSQVAALEQLCGRLPQVRCRFCLLHQMDTDAQWPAACQDSVRHPMCPEYAPLICMPWFPS